MFDCIAALHSVEGLIENLKETYEGIRGTTDDLYDPKGGFKGNMVETDMTNRSSEKEVKDKTMGYSADIIYVLMEMFVFCVMLVCNSCALLAMRRKQAYLLVPWLSVFLLGIFRSGQVWQVCQVSQVCQVPRLVFRDPILRKNSYM